MPPAPRKRLKESFFTPRSAKPKLVAVEEYKEKEGDDDLDADTKLAILSSLYPSVDQSTLCSSQQMARYRAIKMSGNAPRKTSGGQQSSLTSFLSTPSVPKPPPNGQAMHLYSPLHVSTLTPCTLHTSFLPPALAKTLLTELLQESTTFPPPSQFTLFSRTVTSPHTSAFFTPTPTLTPYYYQGKTLPPPRAFTQSMTAASSLIQSHLRSTVLGWTATAAFVNAYAGAAQGVGYHSDALTYLGPRATIATLSLGAQREFRLKPHPPSPDTHPHTYAIHLPHNSLLVMTAGVQEAWKHSVPLVRTVDAHPLAGVVRIAVTWRWYRDGFAPEKIPRCKCGVGMMLKPVFAKEEGGDGGDGRRYYWACEGGYRVDGEGCGGFRWAEFDEDGNILEGKDPGEASKPDVKVGVT